MGPSGALWGTLWGQTLGPHFDGDPCEGTLCGHTLGHGFKEYLGSSGELWGDTLVANVRPQDVPLKGHPKSCLKVCTQSVPSSVPFDLNCPPKCAPRVALLSQRVYPQCSPKVSAWGGNTLGAHVCPRGTHWGKTVGKIWAPVEHCGAHSGGRLWGRTLMGIPLREHFVGTRWGTTLRNT